MIYPQGKPIHQNLSAEYTDVPQLLSSLEGGSFSGVVEIEGGGTKGVFFIAAGRMIEAAVGVDSDPPAMTGDDARRELLVLARQPQGLLNVYELTAAQVEVAAGPLRSECLFKDLSTDFIRMEQFVKKLGDERHTGYIEILSKDGRRIGVLAFRNGDPVALQTFSESGQVTLFEGEAVPSVLDNATRHGALFNVYRTAGLTGEAGQAPGADNGGPDGREGMEPVPPEKPKSQARQAGGPAVQQKKRSVAAAAPDLPQETAEAPKESPGPPPMDTVPEVEAADDASTSGRREFISALQRVLSKIESFVDHISKKGDFQRIFRRVCVDASDLFHFLDPFEGQFEYESGRIRLDDAIGSDDFAVATAYCLNLVLAELNKEYLRGATLPPGLKGEIEAAFRHYKEAIKNAGLNFVVPANMR